MTRNRWCGRHVGWSGYHRPNELIHQGSNGRCRFYGRVLVIQAACFQVNIMVVQRIRGISRVRKERIVAVSIATAGVGKVVMYRRRSDHSRSVDGCQGARLSTWKIEHGVVSEFGVSNDRSVIVEDEPLCAVGARWP